MTEIFEKLTKLQNDGWLVKVRNDNPTSKRVIGPEKRVKQQRYNRCVDYKDLLDFTAVLKWVSIRGTHNWGTGWKYSVWARTNGGGYTTRLPSRSNYDDAYDKALKILDEETEPVGRALYTKDDLPDPVSLDCEQNWYATRTINRWDSKTRERKPNLLLEFYMIYSVECMGIVAINDSLEAKDPIMLQKDIYFESL